MSSFSEASIERDPTVYCIHYWQAKEAYLVVSMHILLCTAHTCTVILYVILNSVGNI